jgi:hypothetical protein
MKRSFAPDTETKIFEDLLSAETPALNCAQPTLDPKRTREIKKGGWCFKVTPTRQTSFLLLPPSPLSIHSPQCSPLPLMPGDPNCCHDQPGMYREPFRPLTLLKESQQAQFMGAWSVEPTLYVYSVPTTPVLTALKAPPQVM